MNRLSRLGCVTPVLVGLLAGCGGESATAQDEGVEGALRDVVSGLENRDGQVVCAHLHRNAQDALTVGRDAPDCVSAVNAGTLDGQLLRSAAELATYDIAVEGDLATVTGPGADALARLLHLRGLWLSFFEDEWMLQSRADDNGGTAG